MNNLGRKENIFWESISIGFSEAVSLLLAIFNLRKTKNAAIQAVTESVLYLGTLLNSFSAEEIIN